MPQICSLPTEILFTILRAVLDVIVEHDMMTSPEYKHYMLPGGLPFPHTMALVCRLWRDIVISSPGFWTRIFCVLSSPNIQLVLNSQLEKTGSFPVDLTIISDHYSNVPNDLSCIERHIWRLRSLRIKNIAGRVTGINSCATAPLLECLRLEHTATSDAQRLIDINRLDCPNLRILHIDKLISSVIDPKWLKNNLRHVDSVTISFERSQEDKVLRALSSTLPRRIPRLTLNCHSFSSLHMQNPDIKIGAEKVILQSRNDEPVAVIDDHCGKTTIFRHCRFPIAIQTLPSSSTLEFDRCCLNSCESKVIKWKWDGDTIIITNTSPSCMEAIFDALCVPTSSEGGSCFLWSNVTTLKLVAMDSWKMKFLMKSLMDVVDSRFTRGKALQKNLEEGEELDELGVEDVKPITVLHVHGGPPLSRKSRLWFTKRVKDFVWDYRRI